jgi:branched-chain amino acid aminotransferase
MSPTNIQPMYACTVDEIFVTSTADGIIAVSQVDDEIIGNESTGAVPRPLQSAYWAMHNHSDYSSEINYKN